MQLDCGVLVVYSDGGAAAPVQWFADEEAAADWIESEHGGGGNWMMYEIVEDEHNDNGVYYE